MAKETLKIELKVDGAAAAVADTKRVEQGVVSLSGTVQSTSNQLAGLRRVLGALGFGLVVRDLFNVNREMQSLRASLETVTRSAAGATAAFDLIKTFASETPFSIQQVTEAFIKLTSMGLDPSAEALRSYGNTASAMGKSLNQMIEAVADAATGEFERLKEFGIKASQQGDFVTFTFRGVSTTVQKEAGAIEDYLQRIGNVDFAGGMTRQMETIDGAVSNLGDAWDNLLDTLAGGRTEAAIAAVIRWLSDIVNTISNSVIPAIDRLLRSWGLLTTKFEDLTVEQVGIDLAALRREMDGVRSAMQAAEQDAERLSMVGWGMLGDPAKQARERAAELRQEFDRLSGQYQKLMDRQTELTSKTEQANTGIDRLGTTAATTTEKVSKLSDSIKKTDDDLQKLLDTLLPAEKATREFEEAVALLDEAFFSGAISSERYEAAIWELTSGVPEAAGAAAKGASKTITQEFDKTSDWMAQSLTDAIMRGFEGGKGFVSNFIETLKNWFSTLILRPTIEMAMGGVTNFVSGLFGGAGGMAGTGGGVGSGLMSGMGNMALSSIGKTAFGQWFAQTGVGQSLGGMFGTGGAAAGMGGAAAGGLIGLAAALVYGLNSSWASKAGYTGTGATLMSILGTGDPIFGTLLGLGFLDSKVDRTPDFSIGAGTGVNIGPIGMDEARNDLRGYVQSQFGQFGVVSQHGGFGDQEVAQGVIDWLKALALFEDELSAFIGDDVTKAVRDALEESTARFKAEDPKNFQEVMDAFLEERFGLIFGAIGGGMGAVYQSIAGEGSAPLEAAQAVTALFTALEGLRSVSEIYTDFVEQQGRTLYESQQLQAESLRELIAGYQGGLEATQELTTALNDQSQLQLQLYAQIDQVIAGIHSTIGGTRESLTLRLFDTDQQRYDYLRGQAESLAASLGSMTDPVRIAETIAQINTLTNQGIGLLSEEQLKAGMGQELLDFLSAVEEVSVSQAEQTRANVAAQVELISRQVDAATLQARAAEQQAAAANTMAQAVNAFAAASSRPQAIPGNNGLSLRPL